MAEYTIVKIGETFAVAADGHAVLSFQTIEPAVLVSKVLEQQHTFEGSVEASPPPED